MKNAIVTFPVEGGEVREFPKFLITSMNDFPEYKRKFPLMASLVKPYFEEALNRGDRVIVHQTGAWCTECSQIKVVKIID